MQGERDKDTNPPFFAGPFISASPYIWWLFLFFFYYDLAMSWGSLRGRNTKDEMFPVPFIFSPEPYHREDDYQGL